MQPLHSTHTHVLRYIKLYLINIKISLRFDDNVDRNEEQYITELSVSTSVHIPLPESAKNSLTQR